MYPSALQSMSWFASWWFCSLAALFGFGVALRGLLHTSSAARRRLSAGIDLLWTSTSAASIAVALLAFGQLLWKDHSQQWDEALRSSWDQLASLDGARLVAANCPGGIAVADAQLDLDHDVKAADSPCLAASRIAHRRTRVDEHTKDIVQHCPRTDVRYVSRNFSTSVALSPGASCIATDSATPCMSARCMQEKEVLGIGRDLIPPGRKLHADASLTAYRTTRERMDQTPMHEIYKSTHLFEPTPYFALLPIWALVFGARLARPVAELLDPESEGKGLRQALRSSWNDIRNWRPTGHGLRRRPPERSSWTGGRDVRVRS